MSKRQGTLGMLISLVAVGLVLVTMSGCDSAGAGGGTKDPLLSLEPIQFPTITSSGAVAIAAESQESAVIGGVLTLSEAYTYINNYNDVNNVAIPNALLKGIQDAKRGGADLSQPFTITATATLDRSTEPTYFEGTVQMSSQSSEPLFLLAFNLSGAFTLDDVVGEMRFSADYSKVLFTVAFGSTGRAFLEFDYATGNGFALDNGEGDGAARAGYYVLESFATQNGVFTFRGVEYNPTNPDSDIVIVQSVPNNGIVHYRFDEDGLGPGDTPEQGHFYTYAGSNGTGTAADETALKTSVDSVETGAGNPNENLPEEWFNARQDKIPDFSTSAYTELLTIHQANFS
jgi:hypothetical protein